jgi:hypothetical protein
VSSWQSTGPEVGTRWRGSVRNFADRCDWTFLGLSIANWSFIAFTGVVLLLMIHSYPHTRKLGRDFAGQPVAPGHRMNGPGWMGQGAMGKAGGELQTGRKSVMRKPAYLCHPIL